MFHDIVLHSLSGLSESFEVVDGVFLFFDNLFMFLGDKSVDACSIWDIVSDHDSRSIGSHVNLEFFDIGYCFEVFFGDIKLFLVDSGSVGSVEEVR